jgi:hypothetical protein
VKAYAGLFLSAALLAGGCRAAPPAGASAAQGEVPARIVNPTDASRAELERVVSDMLFGADVTLADDALTESSVLILERGRVQSMTNPPLSGREMREPERFQLVTDGERCFLIHGEDRARYELRDTECVAEE